MAREISRFELSAPQNTPLQDGENGERKCYICLETEGHDLIAPCRCSGSMKWVHRHCLNKWRIDAVNPVNFTRCRQCGFNFRLVLQRRESELREAEERATRRRRRFLFRSVAHFILISVAIQAILCALALAIRAADKEENLVILFNFPQRENTPGAGDGDIVNAVRHHKSTYYCAAVLLSLFCIGVTSAVVGCFHLCFKAGCCDCAVAGPVYNDPMDPIFHYYGCRACGECCADCCYFCGNTPCPACECSVPSGSGMDCCNCNCDSDGDCDGGAAYVLLAVIAFVIIAFIFVGLVMVFVAIVVWMQKLYTRYMQLFELRQLTGEYIVEDLSDTELHRDTTQAAPVQQQFQPSAPPRELVTDMATWKCLSKDLHAVYGYPEGGPTRSMILRNQQAFARQ